MPDKGQYLYAIIASGEAQDFGPMGIGGDNREVYSIPYRDIGVVVSDSPIVKYAVTRVNTLAHQKVMEAVMQRFPMLPVRFGVIGEGLGPIRKRLLEGRYEELKSSLTYMQDKVELGLKVLWNKAELIFAELLENNREIRMLRDRLVSRGGGTQQQQVHLGEMVKKGFESKKEQEERAILETLSGLWVEHRQNKVFGDQMLMNGAFLVQKERERDFDNAVNTLADCHDGRMTFKYVGPVPPCNFVEIVVRW